MPSPSPKATRLNRLCIPLIALTLCAPVLAKDEDRREERSRDDRSLSDSVRQVERNTGGRVVGAERIRASSRDIDRVKVVTPEGRVKVIRHEARSRDDADAERGRGRTKQRDE